MAQFLKSTKVIDCEHPKIVQLVKELTRGLDSPRTRAIVLHDFVRDNVKFGFAPSFCWMKASDVLEKQIGFSNTKSTLFVALLRASAVPARIIYVDISTDVFKDFDIRGTYVDHSYTEVFLHGKWIKTDSYTVDQQLFHKARKKLASEQRVLGYGIHMYGTCTWDGENDAFSQLDPHDSTASILSRRNFGQQDDVYAFYANCNGTHNGGMLQQLLFPWFCASINSKIEQCRSGNIHD